MRIFCAVRHSIDPAEYYGALWSRNFYPALQQLGHSIVESQVDLLPASRFMHIANDFTPEELEVRTNITDRILEEVRRAHETKPIDLFLSYFYSAHFDPAGFHELRRMGIPSVNFYCNSIYQFDYVAAIAAAADFSWHPEKHARELYQRVGANPVWVQMAADPDVYRPLPNVQRKATACFVGQRYADRDRWMAALIRAKIPVEIYGPGWNFSEAAPKISTEHEPTQYLGRSQHRPGTTESYLRAFRELISRDGAVKGISRTIKQVRYRRKTRQLSRLFLSNARGSIPFERIAEIFAEHEVCLNFSNVWADGRPGSRLTPHVRLRDFEAPMCRTCYITGFTDEIQEFYQIGKEIDAYRSAEELVDKTRFYLNNPEAAERLRTAGYQRAQRDHTWVRRFLELFTKIGLKHKVIQKAL